MSERQVPITYYNWLARVGGNFAANHFGAGQNSHPDANKDFKEVFKIWNKEWEAAGVKPKRKVRRGLK